MEEEIIALKEKIDRLQSTLDWMVEHMRSQSISQLVNGINVINPATRLEIILPSQPVSITIGDLSSNSLTYKQPVIYGGGTQHDNKEVVSYFS